MAATLTTGNSNCSLTYQLSSGTYRARFRCKELAIAYGVNSEESHARTERAFYPHRRNLGNFAMTFDFKGWDEYSAAMNWFKDYAEKVLSVKTASAMRVLLPSRDFSCMGVPTTGITFGDHTASMLFSPTINFITVNNVLDVKQRGSTNGPSYTSERQGQTSTTWFYPDSQANRPGQLSQYLYDLAAEQDQNATVADVVRAGSQAGDVNNSPGGPGKGE